MSITIAIPFYNAEEYLLDAIRSVFAQTYQDWELILIDDGSTDGSLKIARSITDPRVRVISDGKNKKLAARLNEVTDLASHDYIARMDADDLMSPLRLEVQHDFLERNPNFDLISTGMYSCSNNDKLLGYRGIDFENPSFTDIMLKKAGVLHASILARRSWYKRNRYNEELLLGQDSDLWLRTAKHNDLKIKIIDQPLYIYREEGNVTRYKLLRAYKNERQYFSKYLDSPIDRKKYIMKSFIKTTLVSMFGAHRFLLSRRNELVTQAMEINFNEIVSIIKETRVHG